MFSIGYDEQTWVYKTYVPDHLLEMTNFPFGNDVRILEAYENISEFTFIDEFGYKSYVNIWNDSSFDINMPNHVYDMVSSDMPSLGNEHDPVIMSIIRDGTITYITKGGQETVVGKYDPEEFRMSVNDVSTYIENLRGQGTSSMTPQDKIQMIENMGGEARMLDTHHLEYTMPEQGDNQVAYSTNVINVHTGHPIRTLEFKHDGSLLNETLFKYVVYDGFLINPHVQTTTWGLVNNTWAKTSISVTQRSNYNINVNGNF